jgi:hypothetical protein
MQAFRTVSVAGMDHQVVKFHKPLQVVRRRVSGHKIASDRTPVFKGVLKAVRLAVSGTRRHPDQAIIGCELMANSLLVLHSDGWREGVRQ